MTDMNLFSLLYMNWLVTPYSEGVIALLSLMDVFDQLCNPYQYGVDPDKLLNYIW